MAQQRPTRSERPPLSSGWEKDLTNQFRRVLSTKRMNELNTSRSNSQRSQRSHRAASRSPKPIHRRPVGAGLPPRHGSGNRLEVDGASMDDFSMGNPPPPTYSSLQNIPLIPTPPSNPQHLQFRNQLHILAETPCKWENPGLLDEAMRVIPLDRIYSEADEESQLLQATADSLGKKPAWAWQDCVIQALLRWFKGTFFSWVNNPPCSRCGSNTIASGMGAPSPDERALGGNRVELYHCSLPECGAYERFPRYNDAFVLLNTRRGRCGEWANCFSMLCRAMGVRVRWVWNSEDHVWTEVYSEYRKRWVHVDACEGKFDQPLLYTEGWGKKLGYCIAFSADGAMDVTRRYCRNPIKCGVERNKVPEEVLLHILDEVRATRRRNKEKQEKFRLEGEDIREEFELRSYYVSTLAKEVASIVPGETSRTLDPDAQKALEGRQSGSTQWVRSRGEGGSANPESRDGQAR